MVQLLQTGGHFRFTTAIDDVNVFRAETLCAAGGVHCHIAAADNGYGLGDDDRRVAFAGVGLHQVDAGQIFIGGHDALESLALDVHEHGQACAGADKNGLVAHFKQLVHRQNLADDHIGHDLNAHGLQLFDLVGNDGLGQTEFGNAVDQNAAGGVQRLEDRDGIALLGKLAGAGQTGRTGADHGDLDAVGGGLFGHLIDVFPVPVGNKALQTSDGDRLALDAADAFALALALLGADTAGEGGKSVGGGDDLIGRLEIALSDLGDEFGDTDIDGAAADAQGLFAVQAALCLVDGHFLSVAERNFLKILIAYIGLLLRHGSLCHLHIRHLRFLPYWISALPIFSMRHIWFCSSSDSWSR